MKNHLRPLILKSLKEKPDCGYGLVSKIEEKTGWKPSYGSVYPLLENMEEKGLISSEKEGRKKVYKLTGKGEKRLGEWDDKKYELYESMEENLRVISVIMEEDMTPMIETMEEMKKGGEDPLQHLKPEFLDFQNKLFKMALEGKTRNHSKQIKQMLTDMTEKLGALDE